MKSYEIQAKGPSERAFNNVSCDEKHESASGYSHSGQFIANSMVNSCIRTVLSD